MFGRFAAFALALPVVFLGAPKLRPEMVVSTEWLAQHLKDPNVVVLHVSRDRAVYDAGHIPGARLLPYSELLVTRAGVPNELPPAADLKALFERAGVSDSSRIILYADDMVLPATRCYFTLDYLGHGSRASLLDGGIQKWRSEGRALSKDAPQVTAGRLTPRPRPELVVSLQAMKDLSAAAAKAEAGTVLVDARAAEEYSGAKPPAGASAGHIPGAVNVLWGQAMVSRDNIAFKPEADLRKLYESAGVTPNRPAVAYCNSGVQATHTYFTLKYLGYSVRLYDGSMSEWSAAKEPVETK
jgi:thiosulfate/3-mercaptopyruvate sulfurtransferase